MWSAIVCTFLHNLSTGPPKKAREGTSVPPTAAATGPRNRPHRPRRRGSRGGLVRGPLVRHSRAGGRGVARPAKAEPTRAAASRRRCGTPAAGAGGSGPPVTPVAALGERLPMATRHAPPGTLAQLRWRPRRGDNGGGGRPPLSLDAPAAIDPRASRACARKLWAAAPGDPACDPLRRRRAGSRRSPPVSSRRHCRPSWRIWPLGRARQSPSSEEAGRCVVLVT